MSKPSRYVGPFWTKVLKGGPDECWPWLGYKGPSGHGLTSLNYLPIYASRKAWILTYGPIRDRLCVNHKSKKVCALQAICCNPNHMYLGTRADNMVDRWSKTPPDRRIPYDRTTVLGPQELERYYQMRREGITVRECAAALGVHHMTIYRKITAVRREKLQKLRADKLVSNSQ